MKKTAAAIAVAAALWFVMFSPWTSGAANFWMEMSISAVVLTCISVFVGRERPEIRRPLLQLLGGVALAFLLWGVFWLGDRISSWMFDFARPQVDAVYSMKDGSSPLVISLLLLLLIGPAEEYFWRGFVQRRLSERAGRFAAFVITAVVYALVHVWSLNFMLVMAALVAGGVWGFVYMLCPRALPALIVSHAVWDALVFVILPI